MQKLDVYEVKERKLPLTLQTRKRKNFERPWVLTRNGKPVAFFKTREEAARVRRDTMEALL